jgi:hypothetical protein
MYVNYSTAFRGDSHLIRVPKSPQDCVSRTSDWLSPDATLKSMNLFCPSSRSLASILAAASTLFALGCASPGPPRAPSLNLPQPVSDLSASRTGNAVELRFTLPHLSTDKTPLYDPKHHRITIRGALCRELDKGDCATIASIQPALSSAAHIPFTWRDELPLALTSGNRHLLSYRVEFFDDTGRSAGKSQPAFTASGPAPTPVSALRAEGTRHGILLQWATPPSTPGEVLLSRTALAPKPALQPKTAAPKSTTRTSGSAIKHDPSDDEVWLATNANAGRTLDTNVVAGEPYSYTAVRRTLTKIGTRALELRSVPSAPIDFTLSESFPPDTPTGLTAAGFQPPANPGETTHFAVDLIWLPVDNSIAAQIASPIAGYNIYRQTLDAQGHPIAPRTRLNTEPVPSPGYHDSTAEPSARYRYSVTAIDGKGNESTPTTITLEPSPQ